MSEDKEVKQWKEKLFYRPKNGYDQIDAEQTGEIFAYAEGYKRFLDAARTEREAVKEAIRMAEDAGFVPYTFGMELQPGAKVYVNNRGKALMLAVLGEQTLDHGCVIAGAHVDSPRLDLKQTPMYEDSELAYFKTHYYGGIKKYQWLTIPLALHGVVALKDGSKVTVRVGEEESDPVFYITDLLPHLSQEQVTKTIAEGFPAENLNLLVGGIPVKDDDKDAVKRGVLAILNAKYGITEEDFISAELEAVPAVKAKDVGFDRAFVASYGHDDRVCTYPEITATLQTETDQTVLCILADKEEIGSEGNTGMQCVLINDLLNEIAKSYGVNPSVLREHSKCISADVTAGYDPAYASAFEEMNAGFVNSGVTMNKFTGARGKSGSNDASAEYIGYLRGVFAKENIVWQTGELGRVDLGGGGTVAKFIANMNIDTVDMGVPVLSMHAPYELISKADLYTAHKAFSAFVK